MNPFVDGYREEADGGGEEIVEVHGDGVVAIDHFFGEDGVDGVAGYAGAGNEIAFDGAGAEGGETVFGGENQDADKAEGHADNFAAGDAFESGEAGEEHDDDGRYGDDDGGVADGGVFEAEGKAALIDQNSEKAQEDEGFYVAAVELCTARRKEENYGHDDRGKFEARGAH